MKLSLRHKLFGHKWRTAYINKKKQYKFIGAYCDECKFGRDELLDFIRKHKPIINSWDKKYFKI